MQLMKKALLGILLLLVAGSAQANERDYSGAYSHPVVPAPVLVELTPPMDLSGTASSNIRIPSNFQLIFGDTRSDDVAIQKSSANTITVTGNLTCTGATCGGTGNAVVLTPSATQTITPSAVAVIPLQIQTFGASTAADFSVLNSSGNTRFSVSPRVAGNTGGTFTFGSSGIGGNIFSQNGVTVIPQSVATGTGLDFPIITAVSATTPTLPVGSTSLLVNAPAGTYEVSVYSVVTTSGVGGTSFTFNLIYTDAQQAQTIAEFTNSTFTAGNVNQGVFVVQNQGATTVSYSITEVGVFSPHPVLALKIIMKRLL